MDEGNSFFTNEPMLEMYIFETSNLIEQLEEILMKVEESERLSEDEINEIFRIMHTIKGSSAMMMISNITKLAHSMEDLFYYVRENKNLEADVSKLSSKTLESLDFIKAEISKIKDGIMADGDENELVEDIKEYLGLISGDKSIEIKREPNNKKQRYYISPGSTIKEETMRKFIVKVTFEKDCQMENIRAYTVIHNLKDSCKELFHLPKDLIEDANCTNYIVLNGFVIYITTPKTKEEIKELIEMEVFVKTIDIEAVEEFDENILEVQEENKKVDVRIYVPETAVQEKEITAPSMKQNIISVNVNRLDKLMDMVGEIVITESMVIKNKDLEGLSLDSFNKAAIQLRKLTDELQDIVMAIRMVPISLVFTKMHRVVRDMSKKLGKEVELEIIGEETEVDKNIIDNISDPIMHLIRNCMDHGIEENDERVDKGKQRKGRVMLEAKNTSGEVVIKVIDDGKGLDKQKILSKARKNGILTKDESDMTEREIFGLIFVPGFSTKEEVTEFSGRGVGMDVVKKNIEKVGGSVFIESVFDIGTTINIKIPLTLAIVDGMEVSVGSSVYTIPIMSIKESFKMKREELIIDTSGNEMVMVRGNCYPIMRLHELFKVETKNTNIEDGIIVMVEAGDRIICLYADALLGEQQVVVKPLPPYLSRYITKECGIAGCTILGDGNISLILDTAGIINGVI
ncbi:MAG TPA: chemotaxis protein CheA [Clostridiales bacterium]|nr:MAG: chemotaxis protein CheA [Clostridiales bacterium GWD2_32_59]HAN09617.1 chemotaxis protein CheA [Clostridiales bacterium]